MTDIVTSSLETFFEHLADTANWYEIELEDVHDQLLNVNIAAAFKEWATD